MNHDEKWHQAFMQIQLHYLQAPPYDRPCYSTPEEEKMIIYGVALLSACLVLGMLIGQTLGYFLGVQANVGGVGIAMLFLVFASNSRLFKGLTEGDSGSGIKFWSAMYIPIVVAMAAQQNVAAALDGGVLAILAGVAAVVVSFLLVPVLSKIGRSSSSQGQDS